MSSAGAAHTLGRTYAESIYREGVIREIIIDDSLVRLLEKSNALHFTMLRLRPSYREDVAIG
jgi:hypothetical protein